MLEQFPCFGLIGLPIHFASYKEYIQQHHDLDPSCPNLHHVKGMCFLKVRTWIFYILPNFQKSMKGQGMCEMHMFLIVGKKWSMHTTAQGHPKLKF
jgi:hypothetical protein